MNTAILLGGKKTQEVVKNNKSVKKEVCFLCKTKKQSTPKNILQEQVKS